MGFFSFRAPFTRRQCALALLFLVFSAWLYAIATYSQTRHASWHGVEAKVIELQGSGYTKTKILLYEFGNQPYVAMISNVANSNIHSSWILAGSVLTVFVNESRPHKPVLDLAPVTRSRLTSSVAIIVLSCIALYVTLRLVRTLESEAVLSQSIGDFDHLIEEFGSSGGWSDAFVELLDRQTPIEDKRSGSRASGGSRVSSTDPTTIA